MQTHFLSLAILIALIYLGVALHFWRNQAAGLSEQKLNIERALIAIALLLHGYLLNQVIFGRGFNFGFYQAISVIMWLTVLIYWLADLKLTLSSLQAFVLPPAAVAALLPALLSSNRYWPQTMPLFNAHIAVALLAYSLFTFAAIHAVIMYFAEANLHQKPAALKMPTFPPLMAMENLLFKIIWLGFILLTITLISGMFFSEQIFGKALQFNHKTIFSIASWLIYGLLLYGRFKFGWRGKKAIRFTIGGFILLLLAYVGSKFVLEVLLGR